ncbi:hypothetical protein WKI68_05090 [Streptomyces sp. MS1.HAVA.3]|uniref:Chloride channel protein n=1 Tax=Streptomyces caledonius TaxID=3134107 RepID=A0ABU8TZI3_9ACTN
MTESDQRSAGPSKATQPEEADRLGELLRSPGYFKALVFCALIGVPVSLVAFWFLVALHELEHVMWDGLPQALGWDVPPWWWPLPLLLVAGTTVGLVVTRLPGGGGHIPASGLHTGGVSPEPCPA